MNRNTEVGRLAHNAYMRAYRKRPENLAKDTARKQAWIAASPENAEKHRLHRLRTARKKRWGTPEAYAARLASQNGLCALCRQPFDNTELGSPVQDHNHETLALREFLHRRCNLGIGNLLDDPKLCRLAAEYLERHSLE